MSPHAAGIKKIMTNHEKRGAGVAMTELKRSIFSRDFLDREIAKIVADFSNLRVSLLQRYRLVAGNIK